MISIGSTFAYYSANETIINITSIKSGNLIMNMEVESGNKEELYPINCTDSGVIRRKIVVTTTNTSGGKVSFTLGLKLITLSSDLKRSTLKWTLTTGSSCNTGVIASGNFANAKVNESFYLVQNDYNNITYNSTNSTYTKTYYLYIWLDRSETSFVSGELQVEVTGSTSNDPEL